MKLATLLFIFTVINIKYAQSGFLERSYEYVMNLGKNLAPSFINILDCFTEEDGWSCARDKASKMLDGWEKDVDKQRSLWQREADAEVISSGRSLQVLPSQIGREIDESLKLVAAMVNNGVARALGKKHGGGIDSITISTGGGDKKKMKKKKNKPPKIHLIHPMAIPMQKHEKGRSFGRVQSWVVGSTDKVDVESTTVNNYRRGRSLDASNVENLHTLHDRISNDHVDSVVEYIDEKIKAVDENLGVDDENVAVNVRRGRGFIDDLWAAGEEALDDAAEHAIESDKSEDGVEDKSSIEEQRGKKKKKKKAILKLLILGAVLKAKIGTILQILSFKLQVKFFILALLGLGINLARLWIDIKNKHSQQPQKVIYYEHAQHQHHYDHEEDHGWGPWSRSIDPEVDSELDLDVQAANPYRAHDRQSQVYRPLLTKD